MTFLASQLLPPEVCQQVLVPEVPQSCDFIVDEVRNHKGEPFSMIDFPWTKGICDAWDDPDVRQIALQFAARIGKTQLAQSLMVATIAHDPATWMYGNATEKLVIRTVRDKYYPMFEMCPTTNSWVPPKSRRLQAEVVLSTCRGYTGWSGSPITLADLDPKYLHAGEIDKWSKNKSEEADPLALFLQRGVEIPDRKVIIESTPAIQHRSRIESALLSGWNCRFYCPCPRCGHYQPLEWGEGPDKKGNYPTGGIVFDKLNGKIHADTAYRTARYLCEKCRKEWHDDEKREVVQAGQWVPAGQHLTKSGKIRGTMQNPGPNASYQLSRLYAPTFTFGDVARDFVIAELGSEELMRDWRNSCMGWTWSPLVAQKPWEEVAKLLCETEPYELRMIPLPGWFLTAAVDVQDESWVYKVTAWGQEQRGWVVDYGVLHSWDEVSSLIRTKYQHADGGEPMPIAMTLCDARDGNRKDEVIDFCRANDTGCRIKYLKERIPQVTAEDEKNELIAELSQLSREKVRFVWPYMGSSQNLTSGAAYRHQPIDDANKKITKKLAVRKKHSMFGWITGNTNWFQQWINNCLYRRTPGNRMSLAYPQNSVTDRDLFEQLINESPSISLDTTGHDRILWVVVREDVPVDYRDCARMCRCGAEVYLRGNWARVPSRRRKPTRAMEPKAVQPTAPQPIRSQRSSKPKRYIRQPSSRRYGRRRK